MTAQTTKSIKMDIISNQGLDGCMRGVATWMAQVLKAEESQIILAIDVRHIHARATVVYCLPAGLPADAN